jgi:hypothetical protein
MTNKILLVISTIFLLSGCSLDSLLKRSANNKLVDMKGFHGGKRRPLYNKKYIDRAKANISQNEYDDEEEDYDDEYADEKMSPSVRNRFMYQDMIEKDLDAKRQKKTKKQGSYRSHMAVPDKYQDVAHAREIARQGNSGESDIELRRELSEIKSMLSSAKKDLTKYRCPVEKTKEQSVKKSPAPNKKLHEQVYSENDTTGVNPTHKKAGPAHLENSEHITLPPQPQPQQNIAPAPPPQPQIMYADEPSDNTPPPPSAEVVAPAPPLPAQAQPQVPIEAPQVQQQAQPEQAQGQQSNEPAIPALPKFPGN